MDRYYQISMYYETNPIISDSQSAEINTCNIKRAIRHLVSGMVILDGTAFRINSINDFIDRVSDLCDCDKAELIDYAGKVLENSALY